MALNAKHQIFVKEYLVDKNATRSYKVAFPNCKTDNTARTNGSKLLASANIKLEIEKGLKAQMAKAERRAANAGLTRERWLQELRLIAFSNMDDFATVDEVEAYVDRGTKKPVMHTSVNAIATAKRRNPNLGRVIKKISETKNGIGIELHSKQAALETIGRSLGWVKNDLGLGDLPEGAQVLLTMPSNGREAPPDAPLEVEEGKDPEKDE